MCCTVGCALPINGCIFVLAGRFTEGFMEGCIYLDVKPCSYKFNITMFKLIFWVPRLLSSCIFAHTLFIQSPRSASTFHCHCVLMICMAACVSVYCCVVMMLSLKCSLLPGWYYSIIHFLSGGTYSSGGTTDCSQGRCQPSG